MFFVVWSDVKWWEHVCENAGIQCKQKSNWFWEVTGWLELNLNGVHEYNQKLNLKEENWRQTEKGEKENKNQKIINIKFKNLQNEV